MSDSGNTASGQVEHKKQMYNISSARNGEGGSQDMKSLKVLLPRRKAGGHLQLSE
jgi:hypothetical protein